MGFLIGSLQGPLYLSYLGYDGAWCVFLSTYVIGVTLSIFIYPDINSNKNRDELESKPLREASVG